MNKKIILLIILGLLSANILEGSASVPSSSGSRASTAKTTVPDSSFVSALGKTCLYGLAAQGAWTAAHLLESVCAAHPLIVTETGLAATLAGTYAYRLIDGQKKQQVHEWAIRAAALGGLVSIARPLWNTRPFFAIATTASAVYAVAEAYGHAQSLKDGASRVLDFITTQARNGCSKVGAWISSWRTNKSAIAKSSVTSLRPGSSVSDC